MIRLCFICLIMIFALSGCTSVETNEKETISIQYPNTQYFYKKYGQNMEKYLPNLEIKIIESSEEREGDVIFLNGIDTYFEYAANQWLHPLNQFIRDDPDLIADMESYMIDQLSVVDGNIYGLAPRIQSSALYYNKDLFEQYGIPLPQNHMSWEELLSLSDRFHIPTMENDEKVYGLVTPFFRDVPVLLIKKICSNYGIDVTVPAAMIIWEKVLSTYQNGTIYDPEIDQEEEMWINDPFMEGKAAMEIASQVRAYLLRDQNQNDESSGSKINWGVVTVPVNLENPYSEEYKIHDIFGINIQSDKKEAAWEFIKYVNGDTFAKLHAEHPLLINDGFPSRQAYIKEVDGNKMDPFFLLEGKVVHPDDLSTRDAQKRIEEIMKEEVEQVLQGHQSVENAFTLTQEKLQFSLD